MSIQQHQVVTFLEAEVYHTLGSYSASHETLCSLPDEESTIPDTVLIRTRAYNKRLRESIHQATTTGDSSGRRHPSPIQSGESFFQTSTHSKNLTSFYTNVLDRLLLGGSLADFAKQAEDPFSRPHPSLDFITSRYKKRLEEARATNDSSVTLNEEKWTVVTSCDDDTTLGDIDAFVKYLISAFSDAHFRMHQVEHERSGNFRDFMTAAHQPQITQYLRLSLALNTFVTISARLLPWIFAADEAEALQIRKGRRFPKGAGSTFCYWIAHLFSSLALFRRGYTFRLLGKNRLAFNDYTKAQHFMRSAMKSIHSSATFVSRSPSLLLALDAITEYHIGELYRSDHAHTRAHFHFCKSFEQLQDLATPPIAIPDELHISSVLQNSRWRVEVMLSKGKSFYELGHMRRSLRWFVRAWRTFVSVTANENGLQNDLTTCTAVESWLIQGRHQPEIDKNELDGHLSRLANELDTVFVAKGMAGLAADILNRIAHVLFILKIGEGTALHRTSLQFLAHALRNDPDNNLGITNLLKTINRSPHFNGAPHNDVIMSIPPPPSTLTEQHLSCSGTFEKLARLYEQRLLKKSLESNSPSSTTSPQTEIGRHLLADFVTHTDNFNVKLSQLYRYLMKSRCVPDQKGLDILCLRRYGSVFPFLPRPSAFRSLGGGYLLICPSEDGNGFLGILIDPGGDTIENLYRCGHSLADVDVVIMTHDHADHTASFDAILSLLWYKKKLGDSAFDQCPFIVLGNASVVARYQFLDDQTETPVEVIDITSNEKSLGDTTIKGFPTQHKDVFGKPGCAVLIKCAGHNVGFTSDTTSEINPELNESHVLVANIGSVPITELRSMTNLKADDPGLEKIWEDLSIHDIEAKKQIDFALWAYKTDSVDPPTPFEIVPNTYVPPGDHLYLRGILSLAESFSPTLHGGVLVVNELREELGTFRTKIATQINERIFTEEEGKVAVTGDVGLRIRITDEGPRIRCTRCVMDNDCASEEMWHPPHDIREVCVKGEQEGVFYNCMAHDPSSQPKPLFAERMEQYDIFGRDMPA